MAGYKEFFGMEVKKAQATYTSGEELKLTLEANPGRITASMYSHSVELNEEEAQYLHKGLIEAMKVAGYYTGEIA
jgi:hypothetical protein